LPELTRLVTDYTSPDLRFDPRLTANGPTIVDADAIDGTGREVRSDEVAAGPTSDDRYLASTGVSLADVAAGTLTGRVVSWRVQLLSGPHVRIGIGFFDPDRQLVDPYDVYILSAEKDRRWCLCACSEGYVLPDREVDCRWPPPPITVTADLTAGALRFALDFVAASRMASLSESGEETVQRAEWTCPIPADKLATAYALVLLPAGSSARL
jgi:hypothetical protein